MENVLEITDLKKTYKGFALEVPQLRIPKGFVTALIGENGAGKSTLLRVLAGIDTDYTGDMQYFNAFSDKKRDKANSQMKNRIGYTAMGGYYLSHWSIEQVAEISGLLFDSFDIEKFRKLCEDMVVVEEKEDYKKKVGNCSDGTLSKLMLAGVLARDTDLLILDEPASVLDPLMRDRLCEMLQEYMEEGNGERSIFISTHNVSDMEDITDYAVILAQGKVVAEGFTEDLREKYIVVKGEIEDFEAAKDLLIGCRKSQFGFEGLCLAENLEKLTGLDLLKERPTLSQISVAIIKEHTNMV